MGEMTIERTKRGYPAMWEKGGGMTNTGWARIITGPQYERKKPIYIRRRGHLANGRHALFVVGVGDKIITADHHRGDFAISIKEIVRIRTDSDKTIIETRTVNRYSQGEWEYELLPEAKEAVEVVKDKATCYHCREPHYIKEV